MTDKPRDADPFSRDEFERLVSMRAQIHVLDGTDNPRPNIVDRLMATVRKGFRND